MKKSDAILAISEKLQKQIYLMVSMGNSPKMLCDNLASRVVTAIEQIGMEPPKYKKFITDEEELNDYDRNSITPFLGWEIVNEWENEDD